MELNPSGKCQLEKLACRQVLNLQALSKHFRQSVAPVVFEKDLLQSFAADLSSAVESERLKSALTFAAVELEPFVG